MPDSINYIYSRWYFCSTNTSVFCCLFDTWSDSSMYRIQRKVTVVATEV